MTKKSGTKREVNLTAKVAAPIKATVESPPAPAVVPKVEYAFPSKSRCPRCRGMNTRAYGTTGGVQYRECLSGICRNEYKVLGKVI